MAAVMPLSNLPTRRSFFGFAERIACCVAFSLTFSLTPVAAGQAARALTVYVDGSVPGFGSGELPQAIALLMRGVHLPEWSFVAGNRARSPLAPDRVEWTIRTLPHAGDALHRIGRLLSRQEDLFGQYRYVSIEVRFFLNGLYQTTSFSTGEIQGGAADPKLAILVKEIALPLLTVGLSPERVFPAQQTPRR